MKKTLNLLKECTILYVENDKKIASSVLSLYEAIFKEVHFANNGKNGLELFRNLHNEIDLTITEVNLPFLSGTQMVTNIRKDYGYNHPVIFVTNKTDDQTLLSCLKLGAADYLIKPVQHQTHLGILIKVLKPIYDTKAIHLMNQELEIYKKSADSQLLISKTNLDGVITYVNENFCEISQYTKEEFIGQTHCLVRHPDMKNDTFKDLWHTIICGSMWSGTIQNRAKDGTSYFVEAKIFPIKDNLGKIIEFISFRQDITEHVNLNKKATQMLKSTKLNYSKIYQESIEKAKNSVAKEMRNLEYVVNQEREHSRTQATKRARAETKLNETTQEKDKEIQKWKQVVKESSSTLEKISIANKKLTNESRRFNMSLDIRDQKISSSQNKVTELQDDKERLNKQIQNKDDVIKHLEEKLKSKKRKLW